MVEAVGVAEAVGVVEGVVEDVGGAGGAAGDVVGAPVVAVGVAEEGVVINGKWLFCVKR